MKDWQQRVVEERNELYDKIHKLEDFLQQERHDIAQQQWDLLRSQLHYMQLYGDILNTRISAFA
jgi:hypothetical protein